MTIGARFDDAGAEHEILYHVHGNRAVLRIPHPLNEESITFFKDCLAQLDSANEELRKDPFPQGRGQGHGDSSR